MRVVEQAQVLCLGRIRDADLTRLDVQVGLSQAAALDEDLDCKRALVQLRRNGGESRNGGRAARTLWGVLGQNERVARFGKGAFGGHDEAEMLGWEMVVEVTDGCAAGWAGGLSKVRWRATMGGVGRRGQAAVRLRAKNAERMVLRGETRTRNCQVTVATEGVGGEL